MALQKPAEFFKSVRSGLLGPTLDQGEVQGCEAIMAAAAGLPLSYAAYMLATAYLETAHTMQPVMEANWLSKASRERYFFRMYDKHGDRPKVAAELGNTQPGDGVLFCGRGYPQMTGRKNYLKADTALGMGGTLMANPDLAMRPDIAAKIMRYGMVEGWFTKYRLGSFLPSDRAALRTEFVQARRIINGQDRAGDVANYALQFQNALILGGWSV